MILYRVLRRATLALRGFQAAADRAVEVTANVADGLGMQAKNAAHAALDKNIEAQHTRADNAYAAVYRAKQRAGVLAAAAFDFEADAERRRDMIEEENL